LERELLLPRVSGSPQRRVRNIHAPRRSQTMVNAHALTHVLLFAVERRPGNVGPSTTPSSLHCTLQSASDRATATASTSSSSTNRWRRYQENRNISSPSRAARVPPRLLPRASEHALGDAHMDLESGHQLIQRLKKKGRTESVARPRLMAGKRASKAWGAGASGHGGATPPLKVSHATMPDWREGAQRRLANTHPRARACRS